MDQYGTYVSGVADGITFQLAPGLEDCKPMIDITLKKVAAKMNMQVFAGVTVKIGPGLVEGGGETKQAEKLILLNSDNMQLSLQQSEDYLVQQGYFEPGQRTRTLKELKDQPWSTLVYELIHEFGHILDGKLPTHFSPTLYGQRAEHEAFCEALTYWMLDQQLTSETRKALETFRQEKDGSHE